MIKDNIKLYLQNYVTSPDIIKIGYIKEFLQSIIIKQIYEYKNSNNLIFYGGTSLRFLFGLNRLSEDLDFISKDFNDFQGLANHIQKYFISFGIDIKIKIQKFRIILNFKNFLTDFNLNFGNSKDLYIKIEISSNFDFCKNYKIQFYPIFKFNQSLVIKSLDKSSLFSTKLNAVLYRNWQRNTKSGYINVKGRDIYDLFWFMSNGIKPNIDCIDGIENINQLKTKLKSIIDKIDFKQVVLDIENFIEDEGILDFIKNHGKSYILSNIDFLEQEDEKPRKSEERR